MEPDAIQRALACPVLAGRTVGQEIGKVLAGIMVAVGISMVAPPVTPPGPTDVEQLAVRTAALRTVAARERARLVAGMV